MFVYAVKATRRQIVAIVICVVLLAVMLVLAFRPSSAKPTAAVVYAADNSQRVAYLLSLGYEVDPEGEVREVLIPDVFDDPFTAYNALQQQAGMDLSPYHGKRVKCFTYTVKNYPDPAPVKARLYVYKDRIVAGDISSTVQDGFSYPLIRQDAL